MSDILKIMKNGIFRWNLDEEVVRKAAQESDSISQLARKLGAKYINGTVHRAVKKLIETYNVDIGHFDQGKERITKNATKYPSINRKCPVCDIVFVTSEGSTSDKTTCSHSCANKYFRSGPNHPRWNEDTYRSTCFYFHGKQCLVCEEKLIVEAHHVNGDRENNKPENLVPLCPTHHKYWHSPHKHLIEKKIIKYIEEYKNRV